MSAGIDNKKAVFMESSLLNLKNNAVVITIPDLDTPGIIAKACITPIIIIAYILMVLKLLNSLLCLASAIYRTIANRIVIKAIEFIDLMYIETKSINPSATIGRGIDPIMIKLI